MRKSVVLPAPFGPITPTMPAGGSENSRFSNSRRSPNAFETPFASITTSPRRGPGGMWISTRSSFTFSSLGEQLLVRAEARLRLRVSRLRRQAHPLELALQRPLARRGLLLLDGQPRLLLLEPARVVALIGDAAAAIELEDPAGDVVEEVPVVRDRDDGALVVGEEALEPEDGLGVEVVRRLVEQQQIGCAQQEPAERNASALTARQRRHVAVAFRQPQRVHRVVELRLELPRAAAVDLVLHLRLLGEQRVEVGVRLGELRGDLVEAVEQVAHLAHAVLDVLAHRLGGIELGLLLEQADRRVRRELGDARGRLFLARHDPQQRRLARAVRAEDADLRAGEERERDVRQHLPFGAEELVDLVHREDVFAAHGLPR